MHRGRSSRARGGLRAGVLGFGAGCGGACALP